MIRLVLALTFLSSLSYAQGTKNCFNKKGVPEYDTMKMSFQKKDDAKFDQDFQALCAKYPQKLTCSVEKVSKAEAEVKMKEFASQGKCTEVMRRESKELAHLYFINDPSVK